MQVHQDTTPAQLTETERMLIANTLKDTARELRDSVRNWSLTHQEPLATEERVVRMCRADTLTELAYDIEWGNRR